MKKKRDAERLWKKIPLIMDVLTKDLSLNEIYVPYSFEDWNMKHIDSRNASILNIILKSLEYRKSNDIRHSIGWINLSRISDSSVLIFDNENIMNTFLFEKDKKNYKMDEEGFYFYLEPINYADLPGNIKKYLDMSNLKDFSYSIKYYIGISDIVNEDECYTEEYYMILD